MYKKIINFWTKIEGGESKIITVNLLINKCTHFDVDFRFGVVRFTQMCATLSEMKNPKDTLNIIYTSFYKGYFSESANYITQFL